MFNCSKINHLSFLGTMGGEQKLDDQGYRRVYKPFGGSDNIRKEFSVNGNMYGAEGFKTIGNSYSFTPYHLRDGRAFGSSPTTRQGGGFFIPLKTLDEAKQKEMNSFGYALMYCKPALEGQAAPQWELIVNCAKASNIQAIASNFFEPVRDLPKEGDLALYKTYKTAKTASGIKIEAHTVTHAGIYRNSQPNWNSAWGGTIESKWGFVKNPYIFQHDVFSVPDYLGTEVTFLRPKTQLHEWVFSDIKWLSPVQKLSNCQSIQALKGTTALILQASHDSEGVFHPSKGFYKRGKIQLQKAGCSINEELIKTAEDFQSSLSSSPDNSISFLWLRGHGSQNSIQISSSYSINAEDIQKVFRDLPAKLIKKNKAVIYLDSCLNGSLKGDFYCNMQFAFAQLTSQMPNVTIIAPSDVSYMSLFEWNGSDYYHFETAAAPYSIFSDITIHLGEETKKLIRSAQENGSELCQMKEALFQSLQKGKSQGSLWGHYAQIRDSYDNIDVGLLMCISENREDMLDQVRYFVEELGADGNAAKGYSPFFKQSASPLFAAIHIPNGEIVNYLLEQKADPNYSFKGTSLKAYAKEMCQHEIVHLLQNCQAT